MKTSIFVIAAFALSTSALAQSEQRTLSKVTLSDGQELHGYVVEQSDEKFVLELANGPRIEIPPSSVRTVAAENSMKVDVNGELRTRDPNRTRYFYSPSAHLLKGGEGYVSQKELFFTSVAYGVTDNVTILAGAALPAWFLEAGGMNFIVGAKAGGTITEHFHLAAGAETLMIPQLGSSSIGQVFAGFLFGTATIGDEDAHLSVSLGRPFVLSQGFGALPVVIGTASGSIRVHKHLALVTENWLLPSAGATLAFFSGGFRIISGRIAVDVGGIWMLTPAGLLSTVPVPWLDFTYNFG